MPRNDWEKHSDSTQKDCALWYRSRWHKIVKVIELDFESTKAISKKEVAIVHLDRWWKFSSRSSHVTSYSTLRWNVLLYNWFETQCWSRVGEKYCRPDAGRRIHTCVRSLQLDPSEQNSAHLWCAHCASAIWRGWEQSLFIFLQSPLKECPFHGLCGKGSWQKYARSLVITTITNPPNGSQHMKMLRAGWFSRRSPAKRCANRAAFSKTRTVISLGIYSDFACGSHFSPE
jgi:hypothetical protein